MSVAKEAASPLWVRIKPRNDRRGNRARRFMIFGIRFEEEKSWYKVSGQISAVVGGEETRVNMRKFLSVIRNDNDDPESAPVFDIVNSLEEAQAIDAAEEAERKGDRSRRAPVDATTADLAGGTPVIRTGKPGRPRKMRQDDDHPATTRESDAREAAREQRRFSTE